MQYHQALAKISIPNSKLASLNKLLTHNGENIIPYHLQGRKKDDSQVRFDDKCKTAEKLGLISKFLNSAGEEVDLPTEIIEIYGYRNAIHLIAEQRKGIEYCISVRPARSISHARTSWGTIIPGTLCGSARSTGAGALGPQEMLRSAAAGTSDQPSH